MITFLPKPKFASKWLIDVMQAPMNWKAVVESACIWAFAVEKRLRDKNIELIVRFIHDSQMKQMQEAVSAENGVLLGDEMVVLFKPITKSVQQKNKPYNSRPTIAMGEILCCATHVYDQAKKAGEPLFEHLVRIFTYANLELLGCPDKDKAQMGRKILTKFSLC